MALSQERIFQALLEGKKIRQPQWVDKNQYVYFSKGNLCLRDKGNDLSFTQLDLYDNWELCTPTVTFFEALEAMKEGKMAMREDNILNSTCPICFGENDCLVLYKTNSVYTITKKDLISKWQILEGDENGIN